MSVTESTGPTLEHAGLALAFLERRRAALEERIALAAHDAVAAEEVAFADVRRAAGPALDATVGVLRGTSEPAVALRLHQAAACALDQGVGIGAVVRAIAAAEAAVIGLVADEEPLAAAAVARAVGLVATDVASAAARSLEEQSRALLRRRADRTDRFRRAAGELAAAALSPERVVDVLLDAAGDVVGCDWAALALEDDGDALAVVAVRGRGPGWAARWNLRRDEGFVAAALAARDVVVSGDPGQIAFSGADAPDAVVAAPVVGLDGVPFGVVFGGRDHQSLPDEEDSALLGALGSVGGRALAAARQAGSARRAAEVVEALGEASELVMRADTNGALTAVARAAAIAADAEVAVVRLPDADGSLVVEGVYARRAALAAELAGARAQREGFAGDDPVIRRALERLGGDATRTALPVGDGGELLVMRSGPAAIAGGALDLLRTTARQADLVVRAAASPGTPRAVPAELVEAALELAGAVDEAGVIRAASQLAGSGDADAADHVVEVPVPGAAGRGTLRVAIAHDADEDAERAKLEPIAARVAVVLDRLRQARERDEDARRLAALVDLALRADGATALAPTLAGLGAHATALVPGARVVVFALEDGRLVQAEPASALGSELAVSVATLLRAEPEAEVATGAGDADGIAPDDDGELTVVRLRASGQDVGAVAVVGGTPGGTAALRRHAAGMALGLVSARRAADGARLEGELERTLAAEGELRTELAAIVGIVRAEAEGQPWPRVASAVAEAVSALAAADTACVFVGDPGIGLQLEALHVAAPSLREPVQRVLGRGRFQPPAAALPSLRAGRPVILDGDALAGAGFLGPLLAPGATVGLVPVRRDSVVAAVLVAASLDPERPINPAVLGRIERLAFHVSLALPSA